MNSSRRAILFIFLLLIFFPKPSLVFAQGLNIDKYKYISPKPGSPNINPENNIILRPGGLIDQSTISDELFIVTGSLSSIHAGKLILSDDRQTMIFLPENSFKYGEEISVRFNGGVKSVEGEVLSPVEFNFFIKTRIPDDEDLRKINMSVDLVELNIDQENTIVNDNLINGYPEINVNISDNPSPGYFFVSLLASNQPSYLMIINNRGVPVFYLKTSRVVRDFHLQPDGSITFFDHSVSRFYKMDSSYAITDSFYCGNGFAETTDFHELILMENGHSILMARENLIVRMDTIVTGGDSAAIVSGFVIQELDANKNVIFQWRTFDHFLITDATEDINLLAHFINPFHCNSLALDDDDNLLLSSRHLDEITKIDRQTGNIIWRFGGLKCTNNEFTFTNDPRTFSHQHYARRLDNGNIMLFDNGNLHSQQYSRSLEYYLDEINKSATLAWSFANNPLTLTGAAGSSQRLSDSNTVIGWGVGESDSPDITETDLNGNITFEASFTDPYTSYRAPKYSWKTNLFLTDPDSIFFDSVPAGDSAEITITLISNSSQPVNITGFHNNDSQYIVNHPVPFTLSPFGAENVNIMFRPAAEGFFTDTMHIRSETDTTLIAQVLILAGRTDSVYSGTENENIISDFHLEQNFPNPFNLITTIRFAIQGLRFTTLKVFDMLGREIASLMNEVKPAGSYEVEFDASGLPSGVYLYRLQAGKYSDTRKLILLK
jgi:hypothetical protein